jgi:signal transduction histidine kinase
VAQGALRNVARHSKAHRVEVMLWGSDGGVQLVVKDDGVGFDPGLARPHPSLGLASIRERVHLMQGEVDIESAAGQGTTVLAWVPLNEKSK